MTKDFAHTQKSINNIFQFEKILFIFIPKKLLQSFEKNIQRELLLTHCLLWLA